MMTFHAGGKQVIRGIMEEIVERLKTDGYSTGHIYDTMQYISYLTPFSSEGLKVVLDEMTAEADTWFCSIRLSEPRYAGREDRVPSPCAIRTVSTAYRPGYT